MSKQCKRSTMPQDTNFTIETYEMINRDSSEKGMYHEDVRASKGIIIHDGATYGRTGDIQLDLDSIPDHVRESIAEGTLQAVQEFLSQPGAREYLDKKKSLRKAR